MQLAIAHPHKRDLILIIEKLKKKRDSPTAMDNRMANRSNFPTD